MRECRGDLAGTSLQSSSLERVPRDVTHRLVAEGVGEDVQHTRGARLRGETTVLKCSEHRKDIRLLVAATDTDARAAVGAIAGDVATFVAYAAGRDGQVARKKVDQRCLPGAIRTEHRVQLTALQLNRHIARGHEAAEAARKSLRAQDRVTHRRRLRQARA